MPRQTRSVPRDWYDDEEYDRVRGSNSHSHRRSHSSGGTGSARRLKAVGKLAMAAVKFGGAAAILASDRLGTNGSQSRGRSRSRSRSRSNARRPHSSHRRSRSSSSSPTLGPEEARIKQAVQAAVTAGAIEAIRARHEPGGWFGRKGERVMTAAITAAGVDGVIDRDPERHPRLHIIESALAGLAAERVINGSRSH